MMAKIIKLRGWGQNFLVLNFKTKIHKNRKLQIKGMFHYFNVTKFRGDYFKFHMN